jgi:hypothetical protein
MTRTGGGCANQGGVALQAAAMHQQAAFPLDVLDAKKITAAIRFTLATQKPAAIGCLDDALRIVRSRLQG